MLRKGQHTGESEDPEQQSQEAEPSKEGTSTDPADEDAANDQDTAGSVSPSKQAPPEKTASQEE